MFIFFCIYLPRFFYYKIGHYLHHLHVFFFNKSLLSVVDKLECTSNSTVFVWQMDTRQRNRKIYQVNNSIYSICFITFFLRFKKKKKKFQCVFVYVSVRVCLCVYVCFQVCHKIFKLNNKFQNHVYLCGISIVTHFLYSAIIIVII